MSEQSPMNRFRHESTTSMRTSPHNLLKFNGRSIYFLTNVVVWGEGMFVVFFFYRMKLKFNYHGVWFRKMLILMVLRILQKSQSEANWAYVPGPPILHPAVWEGKEIVVTVNNIHLLDQLYTQELLPT